jgi:chromosomal replication initiation ATPase DnaA
MTPRVDFYALVAAVRNNVRRADIFAPTRGTKRTIRARREVMRRLRDDGFTTTQIGRWMGRDHSTVIHATRGQK